jgi:hypothetical protein
MKKSGIAKLILQIVLSVAVFMPGHVAADVLKLEIPDVLLLENPEGILKAHKIRISEDSVVAALGNDDSSVRLAAAKVLVKRWPFRATSAIQDILEAESDESVRISMSVAIAGSGASMHARG